MVSRALCPCSTATPCRTSRAAWTLPAATSPSSSSRFADIIIFVPRVTRTQLLLLRGYAFNDSADFETICQMKEKLCYVAYDTDVEKKLALEPTVLVEQYKVCHNRFCS